MSTDGSDQMDGLKKEEAYPVKKDLKYWTVGDYNWKYLCTPQWPWCRGNKRRSPPQFFGKDSWLGLLTAAVMGLQHAMAMLAGLTTVPYLIGNNALQEAEKMFGVDSAEYDEAIQTQQYLISAGLIICGIMTMVQVTAIPLPFKRQIGAGILSVMGISFTTFSPANSTIQKLIGEGETFNEAYGKVLGTAALCALVPVAISFLPHRAIKRIFPPVVCGVTIVLIGINLCGVGMKAWGGGAFCADNYKGLEIPVDGACSFVNATTNELQPVFDPKTKTDTCYINVPINCRNGDVILPFGSAAFIGLGFAVFSMIVILELFGSPFMRNVIIALLFGYMIAGIATYDGAKFVTGAKISAAPAITFLWVHTFPLKIYAPLILPMLIVFTITSIETVGDVAATEEASFISTEGPSHDKRIRGALLNDGIGGIFSALATSLPLTTFAQNNGVISLTAVASRQAGWSCAIWLFVLGVIAKFAAVITTIPDCVFGGMTTFLFANVIASGIKIIVGDHLTRRNRVILAFSMALGVGVTLVPQWATNALWPCTGCSEGVKGLQEAVITILETGFCIGALTAIFLNLVLPMETPMIVPAPTSKGLPINQEPSFIRHDDDNMEPPSQEPMAKYDAAASGAPAGAIVV
ncbi:hypothetical protein CHLNCDRAFT_145360 [Chlorella variabilis]|uniref:Uric acid-xanthine permease n=1 Tax=Chlorella variabilis TaxID=554065 RepID=E1ZE94_CHLVA|nr:hypothetical protein CHLNCDRAFT_145360 [Chlorella variabilis]EFN55989.1 hypothetical protein CHLNCDRAFT_145360 [Chlorella variabilis]|eukprot:XP_005848091.1 hypothetical protein CHLNCDRAFT_145360 [Chlorella variabilis]